MLSVLLAGCAPVLNLPQQDGLAKVRTLVANASRSYGVMQPFITVQESLDRAGAEYKQGNLYLTTRVLTSPDLEPLVAHEMAHYVLKHEVLRGVTQREIDLQKPGREMEANAEAVRVLMRAQGLDEAAAVRRIHAWLMTLQRKRIPLAKGHASWCEEAEDLGRHFPAVALNYAECRMTTENLPAGLKP